MISPGALAVLMEVAESLTEWVPKASTYDAQQATDPAGDRPGDRFNAAAQWGEWLPRWGWKCLGGRYWQRPGKDGPGNSATVGYCHGRAGNDLLYVFSSNASPLEPDTTYSLFAAYAAYEHDNNFTAAARKLGTDGLGEAGLGIELKYSKTLPDSTVLNGHVTVPVPAEPTLAEPSVDTDQDATAADLIRLNATIRWVWKGWIPVGVLTILASEPGIGKTRFCADLARRVYRGLPWPDGADPTCAHNGTVLWVAADNQHAELGTLPGTFNFPPEALYLNAPKSNPFGGTMLDSPIDTKDFEARIARLRPSLVFIDTSLNATDRSAHKPEDAKAFFVPLQKIALRQQAAIICVTHTNAAGKPLGRRITGQGRLVIQLSKPDPDGQPNRRKLWVTKSHSAFPEPLGVTMGDSGNEYDLNPPADVAEGFAPGPRRGPGFASKRVEECREWLSEQLFNGQRRVSQLRSEAEISGFSSKTLYAAVTVMMNDEELKMELIQGRQWWRLTTPDEKERG